MLPGATQAQREALDDGSCGLVLEVEGPELQVCKLRRLLRPLVRVSATMIESVVQRLKCR